MSSYGGAGWCSEPSRRINAARLFIRLIEGKILPGKKLTAASRASTCTPTRARWPAPIVVVRHGRHAWKGMSRAARARLCSMDEWHRELPTIRQRRVTFSLGEETAGGAVVVSKDTVVVACTGSIRATRCSGVPVRAETPLLSPRGPGTDHAEETTPQTRLPVTQPAAAAWLLPCFSQLPWLFTSVGARCSGAKKQAVARRAEFVRLRRSSPAHPRGAADRAPLRASPPAPPRLALRALSNLHMAERVRC